MRQVESMASSCDWAGAYFFDEWVGRGVAAADYTNDGRTSLAVVHQGRPAAVPERPEA